MASEIQGFINLTQALSLYRIKNEEVAAIQAYTSEANKGMDTFIHAFYEWIPEVPEFKSLFNRSGLVEQVKKRQINYWREFFACELNEAYMESRSKVGEVHASINLPISSYVAGMSFAADWWIGTCQ
jgi:rsbT co-antagonist protein RsbR